MNLLGLYLVARKKRGPISNAKIIKFVYWKGEETHNYENGSIK
jgi:hypothetical protein